MREAIGMKIVDMWQWLGECFWPCFCGTSLEITSINLIGSF